MTAPRESTVLRPIDFRPSPKRKQLGWRRFTLWQVAGLAFVICIGAALWFLLSGKAVRIQIVPENAQFSISGGPRFSLGQSHLMLSGEYQLEVHADGYVPLSTPLVVGLEKEQTHRFALTPMPGCVEFVSTPPGAVIFIEGVERGSTPFKVELPAGKTLARAEAPRYQAKDFEIEVIGLNREQTVSIDLERNWAELTIPTRPEDALVTVDDSEEVGRTPGPVHILAGQRTIIISKPGYAPWKDILMVRAGEDIQLPAIELAKAGGKLRVTSSPPGAGVTVDGIYEGTTPVELFLVPNRSNVVELLLNGYRKATRTIQVAPESTRSIHINLEQLTGTLNITTRPEKAEIWVNGKKRGVSNASLVLSATDHKIELRKEGYAGYTENIAIQSNFVQELRVKLLTHEEARIKALQRVRRTADGQSILLLDPTPIRMGASRRQPGRRANEVFRTVQLERFFYMGEREVTNAHFLAFASGHDSGEFDSFTLGKATQPVSNISWNEAALYCNWLSKKEGLAPFYEVDLAKVVGYNANALGYRLPTEAEWSWAARHVDGQANLLLFPWGSQMPPPDRHGNYADMAAQHSIGRIIFGYNDNFIVASPVGTFSPNSKGLFDIGGNVAEWVHNFYSIPSAEAVLDPLGPNDGDYHVIRGSSWMSGTITELRLSFRDYGNDGRTNVGFRVARFAE